MRNIQDISTSNYINKDIFNYKRNKFNHVARYVSLEKNLPISEFMSFATEPILDFFKNCNHIFKLDFFSRRNSKKNISFYIDGFITYYQLGN